MTLLLSSCGGGEIDVGQSTARTEEGLSGCVGHAASSVPGSGAYFLTSFGAGSDSGTMSCGGDTHHGSWYYAASRQRYGCGAHIRIEANGKCVVARTDDYGPDECVEHAAGGAIIDASPLVSQHLFGTASAGWSDHYRIHVTAVSAATPLGPCTGGGGPNNNPPPHNPAHCYSGTLARYVDAGTCLASASDGNWYHCVDGSWQPGQVSCTRSYGYCYSSTVGKSLPARTCVQSRHDNIWYQCDATGWTQPVTNGAGPVGVCAVEYAL